MKRTRRYIFNTLTVVSVLLALATVGLWVDSYWRHLRLIHVNEQETVRFISSGPDGLIVFGHAVIAGRASADTWSPTWHSNERVGTLTLDQFTGFAFNEPTWEIPHWFLTLGFAILPAIWLYKWNKRRKLGSNACASCGYDLTGNESGECPECGAVAETALEPA